MLLYSKFLDLDFLTEEEKNLYYKCVAVNEVVRGRIEVEMPEELKIKINERVIRKLGESNIDFDNPNDVVSLLVTVIQTSLQYPEYVEFANPYFEKHGVSLSDYSRLINLIYSHYYGDRH